MRLLRNWILKIQESDNEEYACIHSMHFSPDGNQLIVAADENIMVYNPHDGVLIKLLRGHKDKVHTVAYSKDGKKFASGGHDKTVIIWNSDLEGILKYGHNDSVQCLSYNPITDQLASCSTLDFAFWSSDVKAVQKHKLGFSGKITSCSWSPDGQNLAIGVNIGCVSIRNKVGEEKVRINRNNCNVWALHWANNYLIVGDWNENLSFYNASGQQIMRERTLGLLPTCISTLGDIILVSGAGGWAVLTSEGIPIYNETAKWIWSIQGNVSNNIVSLGSQDGSLCCYNIVYNTVHALYREKYVYRENMSDVIIHDLTTDAKVRIKCHDRVQKIAIHKSRLAVQLPERIVIYEQRLGEGMLFKVKEKVPLKAECSLLIITSDALLMCQDAKLQMISNINPMTWKVPSPIRYVKVTFISQKEVLLLGLSNGQIWKVCVNNPNAELFISIVSAVRCFDLSAEKQFIAIVDENSVCHIINLLTKQEVFNVENISSVSYHMCCENLLALSGGGNLSIKASSFPEFSQPQTGSVVGFQGSRVFCLQSNSMQTISIPLSHSIHQFAKNGYFKEAFEIACLGVTANEWENLGFAALEKLSLNIARKTFQRSENILYLQLIDTIEELLTNNKNTLALAEICAYRGRYDQAAQMYVNESMDQKALMLYSDLRIFNKAQEFLGSGDSMSLVRKKAEWASHTNEPRVAAEMFLAAGDIKKAAEIMEQNGWVDMLIETGRNIDKGAAESLRYIADALKSTGELEGAAEVYQRLGDQNAVISMTVEAKNWDRAFHLVQMYPEYKAHVYIPYAQLMAKESKFIEAQKAYYLGGEIESAERVLKILIKNAITEERYSDAGYLYWLLAAQCLELANSNTDENKRKESLDSFYENEKLATIYHAFDYIHNSIYEHFSLHQPETLFNTAKVCLSLVETYTRPPLGISLFCIYLCLVRQGKALGANKLARQMLDKIHSLKISPRFQESVEILTLVSWAGHYSDEGALSPLCYRCSHRLPLLAIKCHHCQHASVFSYLTFETLPLIAFKPQNDISTEDAIKYINSMPSNNLDDSVDQNTANVLEIDSMDNEDSFTKKPYEEDEDGTVVCTREELLNLPSAAIIVLPRPPPLSTLFYRNIMPDLHVHSCSNCFKLFYIDDLEMQLISKGQCAFCRASLYGNKLGISQSLMSPKHSHSSPDHSASL